MEQDHGTFFQKGYEKPTRGEHARIWTQRARKYWLGKSAGLSPSHILRNEGVRLYEEGD